MKAIKSETINSCWRKLRPDVVHDLTGFTTEPVKEIMKDIMDMAKKRGDERFQDMDLGEIQELIEIFSFFTIFVGVQLLYNGVLVSAL